jgi:hypothetical protein
MPAISTVRNVRMARVAVTEMLPVAVEPIGDEAEQVEREDEEEDGQQVRDEALAVMADVRKDDLVPDVEDHASIAFAAPLGDGRRFARRTDRATSVMITNRSVAPRNRKTTCLVGERSSATGPIRTGGKLGA